MGPLFLGRAEMSWILRKSLLTSVLLVQPWRTEFTAGLDLGVEGHRAVFGASKPVEEFEFGEGMLALGK